MARPFKDAVTTKHDRIIAKVYRQLYRWGYSSSVIEPLIAKEAYRVLGRGNSTQIGNLGFQCDDDVLSDDSIKKIYKTWSKENTAYFSRINHPKVELQSTAPPQESLGAVISFFMSYMDQEPERCIFKDQPECPNVESWWRIYDGELDGDLSLSPKAKERINSFPSIKRKK